MGEGFLHEHRGEIIDLAIDRERQRRRRERPACPLVVAECEGPRAERRWRSKEQRVETTRGGRKEQSEAASLRRLAVIVLVVMVVYVCVCVQ